ncbi:hypothetical protein B0T26DRAFT_414685 [Lasiosphaeria miniovina]|uniref:Uncharacterized protein n=1 Tax=Lasiosphaeria miniovina TaxID=1954250 RepID=A0AA40A5E0_9PEZI|nr:uncharacterized protein B0T26DRAFT_414685 [Lasiosphaeria miniovina]KAK0709629.1 hypothetical protein B0T26DRAFT_414685 [Lasiosphaeria miniovina]
MRTAYPSRKSSGSTRTSLPAPSLKPTTSDDLLVDPSARSLPRQRMKKLPIQKTRAPYCKQPVAKHTTSKYHVPS